MEAVAEKITRIGVLGGSFDPIHYGHLVTAESARVQFELDTVIFMPTGKSPVEKSSFVTMERRYQMTVLATAENRSFAVSRLEIERQQLSYTIDTLKAIRKEHDENSELFFIAGADAVLEMLSWKDPERLSGYAQFIAATRPGYELGKFQRIREDKPGIPNVDILEIPALTISSTDLRRRIKEGLSVRYLLPDSVIEYIKRNGLYS